MTAATLRWTLLLGLTTLGLCLAGLSPGVAQEERAPAGETVSEDGEAAPVGEAGTEGEEGLEGEEEVELTPMQRIELATTPGEAHELLEPLIGEWDLTFRVWTTVSGEPVESYGSAVSRWILDKRFVRMIYQGEILGRDFEGERVIGYDNQALEYVTTWRDNLGTYTLIFRGRCDDAECRQRTMTADFTDPVSSQRLKNKGVFHLGRPLVPELLEGEAEVEDVAAADDEQEAEENEDAKVAAEGEDALERVVWSDDDDAFTYEAFLVMKDGREFKNLEIVAERR